MINELDIIDYTVLDETDNSKLVLAITDHMNWFFEQKHLLLLQEKLNNYVNYILNEEYKEIYKEELHSFQIKIYLKYKPGKGLGNLLEQFNEALKEQFPDILIDVSSQKL